MAILEVGQALPERQYTPGTVQLFLYNAAIWNAHRIHYDLLYAQDGEGHPGLLVDGPLQGDWLTQLLYDWMGPHDQLLAFEYSNRRAAYVGDVLTAHAEVEAIDDLHITFTLRIVNQHGQATTVGRARVRRA